MARQWGRLEWGGEGYGKVEGYGGLRQAYVTVQEVFHS